MDSIILSNRVLMQQICQKCWNYLSVGPVMISPEKKVICGRCIQNIEELQGTLYNQIAEKCMFRCINYYAGCKELIPFNEMKNHESVCLKNTKFTCPFCSYRGNGCQLIVHVKEIHSKFVAEDGVFSVTLEENFSHIAIVNEDDIIFLGIFVKGNCIKISNFFLTPTNAKEFYLNFYQEGSSTQFMTPSIPVSHEVKNLFALKNDINISEMNEYVIIDINDLEYSYASKKYLWKIKLSKMEICNLLTNSYSTLHVTKIGQEILPKALTDITENQEIGMNLNVEKISKLSVSHLRHFIRKKLQFIQVCQNCKKYISDTVYFCPVYHMSCACVQCRRKSCRACKMFCLWDKVNKLCNIFLPCEWNGCNKEINIFNYLLHVQNCKFRKYKCPSITCGYVGPLTDFKDHWHMAPLIDDNIIRIVTENSIYSWLPELNNELLYITVEENTQQTIKISIFETDALALSTFNVHITFEPSEHCPSPCWKIESFGKSIILPKTVSRMQIVETY